MAEQQNAPGTRARGLTRALLVKIALTAGACGTYLLCLLFLSPPAGPGAFVLGLLPVIVMGWLFGTLSGLLSGVLVSLLAALFYIITRRAEAAALVQGEQLLMAVLLVLLGGVVGRLRDLERLANREAAQREQAEAALREERDRTRTVLNTAQAIIVMLSPDRTVLLINRTGSRLLGLPEAQIVGQDWVKCFVAPSDRDRAAWVFSLLFSGEIDPADYCEFAILTSSGEECIVAWHNTVLRDAAGRVLAVLSSGSDITRHRQAQAQVIRQSAVLGAINRLFREALISRTDEQIADTCLRVAQALTGSQLAFLLERSEAGEMQLVLAGGQTRLGPVARRLMLENMEALGLLRQLLEEGRAVRINSPAALGEPDPRALALGRPSIHSFLGVPLRQGERVNGMLGLGNKPGGYSEDDERDIEAISVALVLALEHRRAELASKRQAEQLEALREIGLELAAELDLDALLRSIVARAIELLAGVSGNLYLHDPQRDVIEWGVGVGEGPAPRETVLRRGEGLSGRVWETGQALTVDDYSQWEGRVPQYERYGWSAVAAAPVHWGGKFLGVLNVQRATPRPFRPEEVRLLTMLADRAAVAIENARLYRAASLRAERLAGVNRIGRAVSSVLELDQLVEVVYREVKATFEADAFFIALYDAERAELEFRLQVDGDVRAPVERMPLQPGLTALVVSQNAPLLIRNLPEERESLPEPLLWGTMRMPASWLGVPMHIGRHVTGVICVQSYRPNAYSEDEQLLLSIVADQVAVAVENARLFEKEREQCALAEALAETASVVNSTLELERVLDLVLEQVERALAFDIGNIMLVEGDQVTSMRWRPEDRLKDTPDARPRVSQVTYLARLERDGEPILVSDTAVEPGWEPPPGLEWVRSSLGAPIRAKGRTVGFLNIGSAQPGRFTAADAEFLQAFASQVGIAIENARLYHQSLDYAEDLEERVRQRTAELETQYIRLQTILSSTSDGIVVTDASGEIVEANPVAQNWLTHSLSPGDAGRLRQGIGEVARQAAVGRVLGPRTGHILELTGLDLELNAAPLHDAAATHTGAVVGVHDVSHLKALDRVKSEFVTSVSHELRTPVATIRLYVDLLRKAAEGDVRHYMDALQQETDRLTRLIEAILNISRIDTGRLELRLQPTDLAALAETMAASFEPLAASHGITLEYRFGQATSLTVSADPERMAQVLYNLVNNAIAYTPSGGRVTISTDRSPRDSREWATLTVADTGAGIPEAEQGRVFERFFRGEYPRLNQLPGTGLGLAIVKEIVQLHGGEVTLHSQVGQGSEFTVWLPLGT